jgi:hypothetical protein
VALPELSQPCPAREPVLRAECPSLATRMEIALCLARSTPDSQAGSIKKKDNARKRGGADRASSSHLTHRCSGEQPGNLGLRINIGEEPSPNIRLLFWLGDAAGLSARKQLSRSNPTLRWWSRAVKRRGIGRIPAQSSVSRLWFASVERLSRKSSLAPKIPGPEC